MPYDANIPQAPDRLVDSQPELLANFTAINNTFAVNHYTFNTNNAGKHNFVVFPASGADPVTAIGEMAIYTKNSTLTTNTELFIRRDNNGAVLHATESGRTANGWSYLPSGLLLKWGQVTPPVAGAQTIIYPVGATIPVFTTVLQTFIQVVNNGPVDNDRSVTLSITGYTAFSFDVFCSVRTAAGTPGATAFNYVTIGT